MLNFLLVLAAVASRPLPQENVFVRTGTADKLRKRGSVVLTLFLKGDPGRLVPLGIALCVDVQDDTHAHGANKIDCNTLLQTDAIAAATTANRGNKRQVLLLTHA